MFPFRDHNPSRRIPYVTWGLIAINCIVFLLTLNADPAWLYSNYALVPDWVEDGNHMSGYLTSMFLHGGWGHILGNMLFLWIFGDNIEDALGHALYLGFYILSGIAASWLHVAFNSGSDTPLIGASGAIAGVMGAYWLLYPRARVDVLIFLVIFVRTFAIPAFFVLSAWLALQAFSQMATPTGGGGVAYLAHLGGFIAGAIMVLPYWLKKGGPKFWDINHSQPPHPPTSAPKFGGIPRIRRQD